MASQKNSIGNKRPQICNKYFYINNEDTIKVMRRCLKLQSLGIRNKNFKIT